ncbi:MAG: 4-hydroxybutyrate CoA-transferase [Bacteroidales bacterium]|nr:4-hydroxybutyrate CoA-transferase [Bacteroidales bacterium]
MDIHYHSAGEAIAQIKDGDNLHWPCVVGAPEMLIEALVHRAQTGELHHIHISHLYTEGYAEYVNPPYNEVIHLDSYFVGGNVRKATWAGFADHIPCSLSQVPGMIESGLHPCDVVLLTSSEIDENQHLSLGTSVDYMIAALSKARLAIVQVNKYMPFTYGDAEMTLEPHSEGCTRYRLRLKNGASVPAMLVRGDKGLIASPYPPLTETDYAIGRHVAELIPDGATLQIGIGSIPSAVLAQLGGHKDLGIHSEMMTGDVIDLVEKGVINGSRKVTDPGKMVAMFLKGDQRLYDFIDRNNDLLMMRMDYTNNPLVIAQNPNVVALNSAIEIDLTGQVCADSVGSRIFSGSGGQLDFMLGASMSKGGIPIIAMPSTTAKGKSKIVRHLTQGAGVVTPRTMVHWVVTEHGAVNLYGKSLEERKRLLLSIADPKSREEIEATV